MESSRRVLPIGMPCGPIWKISENRRGQVLPLPKIGKGVPNTGNIFISDQFLVQHGIKGFVIPTNNHLLKWKQQKYFVTTRKCLVLSTKRLVAAAKFLVAAPKNSFLFSLILLP